MNILVYDIGGTMIKYAVINADHEMISRGAVETPKNSKSEFVACVKRIYEMLKPVEGIAVSMPGRIDNSTGYACTSGVLGYLDQTNVTDVFHTFFDGPVAIDNDGKCAAHAEAAMGVLKDVDDAIVLVFGTGIGGGIIKNHAVHRGHNFSAGEFSFLTSGMGNDTRLFGSDGSIYRLYANYAMLKGVDRSTIDGHQFFDAYESGDEDARKAMAHYCKRVIPYIFNLQFIYDPHLIAIGGGISSRQSFIQALQHGVDAYYETMPYKLVKPQLIATHYRNDANLLGALMNYYDCKKGKRV